MTPNRRTVSDRGQFETCPAIITGPAGRQNLASIVQHTHPRFELLAKLRDAEPPVRARGGLPPGAMRRVHEYIEARERKYRAVDIGDNR